MTTSAYPGGLDTFPTTTSATRTDTGVPHAAHHTLEDDAIAALQALVGITGSTDPATIIGAIAALASGHSGGGSGSIAVYFA